MIAVVCSKCGTTNNVDDVRAGGTARCPGCGATVPVPARIAPPSNSTELRWTDDVGPPPVRRREIPPPPVIDVVDADQIAQAEARIQPRRPRPTQPSSESPVAEPAYYTDAELGLLKPVSPLRSGRRERAQYETIYVEQPSAGVSVGQVLLGCLSSSIGFLVLIGAVVMAILEEFDSTPKLIIWLIVLLTGIFLFGGGVILTIVKGFMGK